MTEDSEPEELSAMLTQLWEAAGPPRGAARQLGVPRPTLRDWRLGHSAPSAGRTEEFWLVVRTLQQWAGSAVRTDAEWEAALRAAQQAGTQRQHEQTTKLWAKDARGRFVQPHGPAAEPAQPGFRERASERAVMNAFIRNSGSGEPSYLCWQADAPVGKTVLLADYVRRPPRGVDILNFFVSAACGLNTRAEFEKCMVEQIGALLRCPPQPWIPRGAPSLRQLFTAAADRSAEHKRKLVLVVDGLDDDVAWSGPAPGDSPTDADLPRGSIAALLPASPPAGMRVIVSLRRWAVLPEDVAARHPLRHRKHVRTLSPIAGTPQSRRTPPAATTLGKTVAGLLAVAGGGLRAQDAAELVGVSADRIDRLLRGPEGRAFVLDDPVLQTYALAGADLAREVRADLGDEEIERHTLTLLTWAQRWQTAGWPEATPPYPLTYGQRLSMDATDRAAYLLDPRRLRRLASVAGHDVALAQLDAYEAEIDANGTDPLPGDLAELLPLAAARTVLQGEARELPFGAPALLVRLGEDARARDVARYAPTPAARAVHLADVAVEMAYADRPGADAVVKEAEGWLTHLGHGFPGPLQDPTTYTRILEAARRLVELGRRSVTRSLLRAVVRDQGAGVEALTEAAKILITVQDLDIAAALHERAETLSQGSTRARTAAVDLWSALAHANPPRSGIAGDHIMAICEELTTQDGLGAVDVWAAAAPALARLPAPRPKVALKATRTALALFAEALADPDALSENDQAHLRRELAGTLARLTRAVDETGGSTRHAFDDIKQLLASLPEHLHIGVLGDLLPERAQVLIEVGEECRAHQDRQAAAALKELDNAHRRFKDGEREQGRAEGERIRSQQVKPATGTRKSRPTPTLQRAKKHRPSMGLPTFDDSPMPDHLLRLHEAEQHLSSGDLLRSRELLETALRRSPITTTRPPLLEGWMMALSQALGTAGEFATAEALSNSLPGTPDRVRHLAALSLGASLGGHSEAAERHAGGAAHLLSDDSPPDLKNLVAQALAYAGDGPAATATIADSTGTAVKRQALTSVAAGLVHHCPAAAAQIAEPLVEGLAQRIDEGIPFRFLPELAALLLAYPNARQPDPRLRQALRRAVLSCAGTATSWHAPSVTVIALLEHLGHIPEEDHPLVAGMKSRWQRSLQPGQPACTELALMSAVTGDSAALRHHAETARTSDGRAAALSAAATHLAGASVALSTNWRADDRVVRTCLALAHASGEGDPPDQKTARHIARSLLRSGDWTHTIVMLPELAPTALGAVSWIMCGFMRAARVTVPR
ncbi:hypothetical protein [Streptomyces fructofermentans]|uniref:Uncharacterized protein n=1 Tax=Streptomyces fructofermentans TaxID=152141 RepID=A0A918NHB1_9ACTN|nr:hypothetical protein [Streptomyces fructofermentans]GGX70445.1 hypothetical protein GCM10010515_42700 [Streptomyces fructofermentans]